MSQPDLFDARKQRSAARRHGRSGVPLRLPVMLLVGCFAAANAAALGLGKLTVQSRLGSPFSAEVDLLLATDDQKFGTECFRLAQPADATPGLPVLTQANLTIERRNGRVRLLIRSSQPVNDPVLQINLRAACGAEVARDYTLIIDPPETATAKPDIDVAPPVVAPTRRAEAPPARDALPARSTGADYPQQWQAAEGETAQSIASNLFPQQPVAQRRFLRALRSANPDVDLGRRGDAPLPAGQSLNIPDSRQVRATTNSINAERAGSEEAPPVARKEKSRSAAPVAETTRAGMSDRLSLSGTSPDDEREANEWSLRLSTDLSYDRITTTSESQRSILRLEYKLLAAIYDQASQQLSIAEQVRQLETTIAELKAATEQSVGAAPAAASPDSIAASVPVVPAAPAPTPAYKSAAPESSYVDWLSNWTWPAGLFAIVALLFWYFRRSSSHLTSTSLSLPDDGGAVTDPPATVALSADDRPPMRSAATDARLSGQSVSDTMILDERPGQHARQSTIAPAADSVNGTTAVVEHYEFDPVMELAEIMLAFGRVKGAAEALQEYIGAHPEGAIQPWIKLIEIYRQNDMRPDYEKLAAQLPTHFNVLPATWDVLSEVVPSPPLTGNEEGLPIDELLTQTPDLAAIPEIRAAIVRQWATPQGMSETLADLDTLLRDKAHSVHQGLSLSMVNEILFLQTVLGNRLEKAR